MASPAKRVLVYGGKGALGQSLIRFFNNKSWATVSIDRALNNDASFSVVVPGDMPWRQQVKAVEEQVAQHKYDAVICVAGGWVGGNLTSDSLIDDTELMWQSSVQPSVFSAQIASRHMREGGLLVLPGAAGATQPTPGMIAYGVAKSAVHHLVRSLAAKDSGLPTNATVTGIMPVILDTEMNRAGMPNANFDNWTKLDEVSGKLFDWAENPASRPRNGSLIRIVTHNNQTTYTEE